MGIRFVLVVLFFLPAFVQADEPASIATDSRVRVTAPLLSKTPLVGRVNLIEPDALVLAPRTRIPLEAITKFELSLGRKPIGQSVTSSGWKGALLFGGIVAAAAAENWDDWDDRSGNKVLFAILGGGAVGAIGGGIYGAFHRPERWQSISPTALKRYAPPGMGNNARE